MLPSVDYFRLDWHPEFKKLKPYLNGQGGVVQIKFESEKAAHTKFSHILKEDFGAPGNKAWLSLRVDTEWSTTYTSDDLVCAFAVKLAEGGIPIHIPGTTSSIGDIFSGNSADGDMTITAQNVAITNGYDHSPFAVRQRVAAVCDGMRRFVETGGHFMVVVNDMAPDAQGRFWKEFWNAGLREAGGENLLLIYFIGPKCGTRPHDDAPSPDLSLTLPTSIESDDAREAAICDDIHTLLTNTGHSPDEATMAVDVIISNNEHSIAAIQQGLAKLFLRLKLRAAGGGA